MDSYTWLKSLHIISVIAWMAGLFYLPRLYVYHTQKEKGSDASETFKIMERKLLVIIMNPAMIASIVSGIILIWILYIDDFSSAGWLHAKILLLVFMVIFHFILSRWQKNLRTTKMLIRKNSIGS